MGKINGLNQDPSGQVGNVVYRQTRKGTVVAKSPKKSSTPRRSEKQMYTRCQLGNVAANYRLYEERLALAFEDKTPSQSEFNLYIQANYGGQNAVFITKRERLNGACVLAPYQFTRGTLKSIGYGLNANGVLVTNINLGNLSITNATTVAQFAQAVMQNNTGWEALDMLSFFYAVQDTDPQTLVPRAEMDSWKVVLDLDDNTPLLNVVPALGFTTVASAGAGSVLGMNLALENAGAAWVHTRDKRDGSNIRVGTQRLYVVNEILESYQTTAAWKASADSYGGVNTKAAYLSPSATMAARDNADDTELDNEVTGGGDTGNNSGSQSGQQSGSETPSGGGGNTTPTVTAPVISGNTPFEETTSVTMSAESGATIYYTTDGSTPTSSSTQYADALTLSDTTTVKAIAIKDGISSSVSSKTFTKGTDNGDGDVG